MSDKYFLDTNILIYAFDPKDPEKQQRARELIAPDAPWIISWQVIQEFCSVALHRFPKPLDPEFLTKLLDLLLVPHCEIYPTPDIWKNALKIHQTTQYRLYDSLILAAALESEATTIYTEDLQQNRIIGNKKILNPFKP